ncbi:hypothetical protein V2E39_23515 [Chryseobacterium arthrosphaerae]|uniref:DUF695 domain-containing protein n=1 Tax=Chryseobacterium arthrosphaerae TaxID=651561 RepID=A0ABU7R6F5_9FLAO|nr:hypothetical protein [Chryseobacterium arthrosphaerae]
MKKISSIILIMLIFVSCNKAKKMKDSLFPERPYEKANIDKFYWVDGYWDYVQIPLVKPYEIQQLQGSKIWMLETHIANPKIETFHGTNTVLSSFDPVDTFNVKDIYIYGSQAEKLDFDEKNTIPKIWFIINTETKDVKGYELESAFKAELKKLNLPETFLNPDEVFEQYKNDPVLPWFPDNIKRQLEEVKARK